MTSWIRTADELGALVSSFAGCRALAIDSESDSFHSHREKVCLIQVAADGGEPHLIDPLELRDLAPLGAVIADPSVVKVLHGAPYDVATLKRDFGFEFAGLFDTMIAAQFLGMPEVGLQAVLQSELGVVITKGGQKDDWSKRPLRPDQEAYALADVAHLIELGAHLGNRLMEAGRLSWAREECEAIAAMPAAVRRQDADSYQRLKGAADLAPRALAVLRELHAWREARADETDTPPFRIMQNSTLLALAASPPATGAPGIMEAVARALAVPDADLPCITRTRRPFVPPGVQKRVDRLKKVRTREAARLGLDPGLVLPQRLIDRIAEVAPRTLESLSEIDGLRRWRVEVIGPALVEALGEH